jgi:hypothetical protein
LLLLILLLLLLLLVALLALSGLLLGVPFVGESTLFKSIDRRLFLAGPSPSYPLVASKIA